MDTRTILIENWGFSPEEVSSKQFQIKKLGEISNEYIEEKAKFYENEYGISHDEFLKIIHVFPSTISLSQQYVLDKFEFYKNTFGFTKQSFKKMIKNGANAISYSVENILDKFHNLQKQYGISASEYGRMIVATPSLIGISYDMFKERETLYIEHFGLTRDEFKKLLLHDAFIFRPANETILQKEESGLSPDKTPLTLANYPYKDRIFCKYCGSRLRRIIARNHSVWWICNGLSRKGKAFCKGVRIPDEKLSPLRNINFSAYIGKELIDGKETYGYSPKPDEWKR